MIEIAGNILVETEHLGSNNAIICTSEGNVLIDAPHRPSDAVRWRRVAQSCGETVFLINTDHHPDHTMCNCFLPGRIVSYVGTRERLQNAPPSRQYLDDLLSVIDPAGQTLMYAYEQRLPTITYEGRMSFELGGLRFELRHVPGHTPNNSLIYLPQQKVLFTGDLVCEAGLPAFIEADTFACIEAVRLIESMDVEIIVPGHGKVCGKPEATRFREQIEALVARIAGEIDRGRSREQIVDSVSYPDNIHCPTGDSPGYPQALIDRFMRGSIGAVHDQILARRATALAA